MKDAVNIEKGFTSEQLEKILDVFTTEGWKLISRDMQLYKKQLDTLEGVETIEDLYKLKGEIQTLDWFIHLKDWYQAAEAYETNL